MSKKSNFKILLMCLALSFSTVCVNVGAMEIEPEKNLNAPKTTNIINNKNIKKIQKYKNNVSPMEIETNYNLNIPKTKNILNDKNIKKTQNYKNKELNKNNAKNKIKTIEKTTSEDNLLFKNRRQTKPNNQITKNIKNKSATKKTKIIYPLPLQAYLKYFDDFYYEKITKKLKDPKTTDEETKNIAVNYLLAMLKKHKTLKDLIMKCEHCIKKINDFYNKFIELTINYNPSINNIPEIRSLYVAMVHYNMHLHETSEDAKKINLNEDKYNKFHKEFLNFYEKFKKVKEYLEKFNSTYKDIFPYTGTSIVMHRQVDKIKNTEETKKDKFLSKIAYSFIENDDDELKIISKTPEKKMTHRLNTNNIKTNTIKETSKDKSVNEIKDSSKYNNNLNIKNKTPDKKMQSIFPFYSLGYELNHIPNKTYETEIISNLMKEETTDEKAISIINNYDLVNKILDTNKLNTKKSLQCRMRYVFDTIKKHWDYCNNTYKNICAIGGMNEQNTEEYKRILRTAYAVIAHLNKHLIEILRDRIYLLKTLPKLSDGTSVLESVEEYMKVNFFRTKSLKIKLKKLEPMYKRAYPYDIKKFNTNNEKKQTINKDC